MRTLLFLILLAPSLWAQEINVAPMAVSVPVAAAAGHLFAPTDSTGLFLWLKPEGQGWSNGGTVSTWKDSSGLKRDFSAPSSKEPDYYENQIDGIGAVKFTLANTDYMIADSATFIANAAGNIWGAFVAKPTLDSTTGRYLTNYGSNSGDFAIVYGFNDGEWEYYTTPARVTIASGIGPNIGYKIVLDTVTNRSEAANTWAIGSANSVSASSPFGGYVSEIILYNKPKTSALVDSVKTYLMRRYPSAAVVP